MKRVIILRGISGSGKSTFANKLVSEGYHIVSRDQLRLNLLGREGLEKYFEAGMDFNLEEHITQVEEREIAGHLIKHHKLIIDDTHTKRVYVQALVNLFFETDTDPDDVEMIEFDVPIDVARKRCDARDKKPISNIVLQKQYSAMQDKFSLMDFRLDEERGYHGWIPRPISRRGKIMDGIYQCREWFIPDFDTELYIPDESLPKGVIVDLDGTSAHRAILTEPTIHMRSFYDYDEVDTDVPDKFTKALIGGLLSMSIEPVFLSGRKRFDTKNGELVDVEALTKKFIEKKLGVIEPTLFMRDPIKDVDENGNDLKDDKVKHRILHEEVAPQFNIIGALDDRARVCAVWEDIGIKCLSCSSINQLGRY